MTNLFSIIISVIEIHLYLIYLIVIYYIMKMCERDFCTSLKCHSVLFIFHLLVHVVVKNLKAIALRIIFITVILVNTEKFLFSKP